MKNIQLNYQNNKDNRSVERWYADNENEIDLIPQKENTQIYCINDNKMYQMEVLDDEQNLTGEYINFIGRNKTNIDKLEVNFQPQQNLNGFDKPWIGGAGTNLLNFDDIVKTNATTSGLENNYTITVSESGTSCIAYKLPDSVAGKTLYISGEISRTGSHANNLAIQIQRKLNGTTGQVVAVNYTNNTAILKDTAITLNSNWTDIQIRIIAAASADSSEGETASVKNLRLCETTGKEWSPYANICPIYGHTTATAYRAGKNLLENTGLSSAVSYGVTFTKNADGSVTANGINNGGGPSLYRIPISMPAGDYLFSSGITIQPAVGKVQCLIWDVTANGRAKKWNGTTRSDGATDAMLHEVKIVAEHQYYMNCYILSNQTANSITFSPMICASSETSTTFEPYQGNSYTVQFGQTIYGGTLDFVTSVLTETWGYITSYNGETLPSEWVSDRDVYAEGATPTTGAAVAYRLATSQTYQLTPQEITTLLGENQIWSDSGIITAKIETKGLTLLPIAPIK